MSIFPTQILLATDGSDESALATEAATGSGRVTACSSAAYPSRGRERGLLD
jgi:hypothetical protein